jgi:hypothetical protein
VCDYLPISTATAQATAIQRVVRGFVVRRWYARKHAREHAAATRMQLMFRSWRALKVRGLAAVVATAAATGRRVAVGGALWCMQGGRSPATRAKACWRAGGCAGPRESIRGLRGLDTRILCRSAHSRDPLQIRDARLWERETEARATWTALLAAEAARAEVEVEGLEQVRRVAGEGTTGDG